MIVVVVASALLVSAADPCAGALDRTEACEAPAQLAAPVGADAKPAPEKPARDPLVVPQQLGFIAVGTAVLGGSALVLSEVRGGSVPAVSDARDAVRMGGFSLLAASGALLSATAALWLFDPSTGTMRVRVEDGG